MRLTTTAAIAAACLIVYACGEDAEPTGTSTTAAEADVSTTAALEGTPIGPDGGSVTSADGKLTLEIPAGALSETVGVEIEVVDPATLDLDGSLLAGEIYELAPDGIEFSAPVQIIRTMNRIDPFLA